MSFSDLGAWIDLFEKEGRSICFDKTHRVKPSLQASFLLHSLSGHELCNFLKCPYNNEKKCQISPIPIVFPAENFPDGRCVFSLCDEVL